MSTPVSETVFAEVVRSAADKLRGKLANTFTWGEYRVASNGFIAIGELGRGASDDDFMRAVLDDGVREGVGTLVRAKAIHEWLGGVDASLYAECQACHGAGATWCASCGASCKPCESCEGTTFAPIGHYRPGMPVGRASKDVFVNRQLAAFVLLLHGADAAPVRVWTRRPIDPVLFRARRWFGLVMPIRVTTNTDDPLPSSWTNLPTLLPEESR